MRKSLHFALAAILAGGSKAMIPSLETAPKQVRLERVDLPGGLGGAAGLPFPTTHLGVVWRGAEEARVEVRLGRPGATLGGWEQVEVADDLSDPAASQMSSGLILAGGATRAEVRLLEGPARDLGLVAIDAATGPQDAPQVGRAASGSLRDASPSATQSGSGGRSVSDPQVISRAGWGADEGMRKGTPEFAPVHKLLVHHTVTPNDDPDPPATVRAIYAYHTQQK
ncbi:MAG: hypothetical protein ACRDV9_12630, partial [Acidimicrobiia bacterium]